MILSPEHQLPADRTRYVVSLGVFLEIPVLVVVWLGWLETRHSGLRDFMIFRAAGRAILHGHSPYVKPTAALLAANDRFVYPTPFALPFVPFALLPQTAANVTYFVLTVAAIAGSLWLLDVKDPRCYGLALVAVPVLSGLSLGAIGPFLLLLTALGWRYRDRTIAGVPLALAAAAKLFLWPLLLWLVLTRRIRASAAAAATLLLAVILWAAIDFEGLRRYPDTVRILNDVQRWKSYSVQTLVVALGGASAVAELVTLMIIVAGVIATAVLARRRDGDRLALIAAILVALLGTPILWLHYLVMLLVPIALVNRRLSLLWLAPLAFAPTPHPESAGAVWRIAFALGIAMLLGCSTLMAARPRERAAKRRVVPAAT